MSNLNAQSKDAASLSTYLCPYLPECAITVGKGEVMSFTDNGLIFQVRDITEAFKGSPKKMMQVNKDPVACQQEWENLVSSLTDNLIQAQGVAYSGGCEIFIEKSTCAALCELIVPDAKPSMV